MPAPTIIPFPDGLARIVSGAELQGRPEWTAAFHTKYKDHRYYDLIERTLDNDFEFHYAVLEDSSGKIHAVQPIFFVRVLAIEEHIRSIAAFMIPLPLAEGAAIIL